jgi:AraC-like DNA-binding protein
MDSVFASTFNVVEWLAVTGLAQSVLIIVYIVFRVRNWRQASLALAYFLVLGLAFSFQFALRLEDYEQPIRLMLWLCRALGPPLCYLLVLQVAKGADLPEPRQFWILALAPLSLIAGFALRDMLHVCDKNALLCPGLFQWLQWLGSISGGIAMLALWAHKNLFGLLRKSKGGMERYWLVLVLIIANVGAVFISFLSSVGSLGQNDADALFAVLGLAFIYLAITTLFRVYPSPVQLSAEPTRFTMQALTPEEKEIAAKVRKLMEVDKLYHEQSFSRADLARELDVSENTLSRVINVAFGKSFPRMLNEFRVDDAKRMLHDHAIPIQVVASEVGFNSLASFNRAFREITSLTPSQYRQTSTASAPQA